ncbi:hypothetical protein BDV98DRAFT_558881 [Pterulicium gracile]|uniref:Uncharacterized protein n=1 Tax=Pterulicium gracile TaxID=1884261 RepID=A0A5C3QXQ9_9AGAR|nr:hypothetical protein BDV98DRAFT_558881 [Pterula gracilis]
MSAISGLSASVTRILSLTGFPKELKTKDIQASFAEWENVNGGFKIKWKDDTSLLIVFQDAAVAKRAYLSTIANPSPILSSDSTGVSATVKPYDGPDAQTIIQAVNARGQHNSNPSRSHNARSASISVFPTSTSNTGRNGNGISPNAGGGGTLHHSNSNSNFRNNITIPEHPYPHGNPREGSPTLPSLPNHPTLNSLISSSLSSDSNGLSAGEARAMHADPAILETSLSEGSGAPRIGNPGKRMVGAALGFRVPSLGPRNVSGNGAAGRVGGMDHQMMRGMGGLVISE